MNHTQLVATIQAYCENDFPQTVGNLTSTQQINTFIQQAEQRIYNSVQFAALRRNVTANATAARQYLSAPNDFLAVYSLAVINPVTGAYEYLLNKDVNFIREAFPHPVTAGKPTHYALFGPTTTAGPTPVLTNELSFILGPTPDQSYTMELHYFFYPESITTSSTSWLGDNFDSVLLYGAMLEAAAYMKTDTDTVTNYQKRYDEALNLAKRLGDGMERQDAYRSGQTRYPVR